MSIAAQLAALTGALQDQGITPVLSPLEATLSGFAGSVGDFRPSLETLSASLSGPSSFDGQIAGKLGELAGSFHVPDSLAVSLQPAGISLAGLVGGIGGIDTRLELLAVDIEGLPSQVGQISATLPFLISAFAGQSLPSGALAVVLRAPRGEFAGIAGTAGGIAAALEKLVLAAAGHADGAGSMVAQLAPLFVSLIGDQDVAQVFRAWAMNTRHGGVTEYTSFPYNSLARYNGAYLAAGANGLVKLEGEKDQTTNIEWDVRTGFHDEDEQFLKRLPEVLMGLRADGPIKVTVWVDQETFYVYTQVVHKLDMLHQVRVKCGKGLRSRYFRVALSGTGPSLELDSMQLPMTKTTRRQG